MYFIITQEGLQKDATILMTKGHFIELSFLV